jgi:hypothetical protein
MIIMNTNISKKLLIAMLSCSFAQIIPLYAGENVKIDSPEAHVANFAQEIWKTNTSKLNALMHLDPNKFNGIKAMYTAKVKAGSHLTLELTKASPIEITEKTTADKTEDLLAPVKVFLPKVKLLKNIIRPLIEISLNRPYTEEEIIKLAPEKDINFETSFFKKSLETTQDINLFIAEHIKTEDDFKQLCGEFYRAFGDLLNHAFPELKHAFEEMVKHAQQKKHTTPESTESAPTA